MKVTIDYHCKQCSEPLGRESKEVNHREVAELKQVTDPNNLVETSKNH